MMSHHEPAANKHPKHDFQVERLAFFSDAVFAIAITLLVIEFKIPHVDEKTTYAEIWNELTAMKYKFFSLLVSFMLIATYWIRHHLLFKHIHSYNRTILILNLLVLLPMIFFPFTTAFFYESTINKEVAVLACQLFLLNNILAGIIMYVMFWLVTKKYTQMSYPMEEKDKEVFSYRVLWMTISMICMFLITFISFNDIGYGLTPMVIANLYKKVSKRKTLKKQHAK